MKSKFRLPFVSTSITEDVILSIVLIPFWWGLGIKFFVFQLLSLFLIAKLFFKRKTVTKISFPVENYSLMVFIGFYVLAIIINLANIPSSRLLASVNNLSFWFMGFLVIIIMYSAIQKTDILPLLRSIRNFALLNSIFVISSLLLYLVFHYYTKIETLLSVIIPAKWMLVIENKAPLLMLSLKPTVVGKTLVFQQPFPRPAGFNLNGNTLGITLILSITLSLAYCRIRKNRLVWGLVLFLGFVALFLSLSRISWLAVFASFIFVYSIDNLNRASLRILLVLVLIGLICFLIIYPPEKIFDTVRDFRKSSTRFRIQLYKISLSEVLKRPVLGFGFKPRTEDMLVPMGSHSTYVGTIYKTGIMGILALSLFFLSVLLKWWMQRKKMKGDNILEPLWFYSGIALIAGFFWMITEDLDYAPIVAFFYFIVIGLVVSLDKMKNRIIEK